MRLLKNPSTYPNFSLEKTPKFLLFSAVACDQIWLHRNKLNKSHLQGHNHTPPPIYSHETYKNFSSESKHGTSHTFKTQNHLIVHGLLRPLACQRSILMPQSKQIIPSLLLFNCRDFLGLIYLCTNRYRSQWRAYLGRSKSCNPRCILYT